MKLSLPLLIAAVSLFATFGAAPDADALQITYEVELEDFEEEPGEPGGPGGFDFWIYTYTLSDVDLSVDQGFAILFDPSDVAGINALGSAGPDWDPIVIQPDPLLPDFGAFDALALVDSPDPSIIFKVGLFWTGTGAPGAQSFVVYDTDFSTIASGTTVPVPEPGTALLVGLGLTALAAARRRDAR